MRATSRIYFENLVVRDLLAHVSDSCGPIPKEYALMSSTRTILTGIRPRLHNVGARSTSEGRRPNFMVNQPEPVLLMR